MCHFKSGILAVFFSALGKLVLAEVWINELHYHNFLVDSGEFVEIAYTAGTSLTGWTLSLYDGATGSVYQTLNITGTGAPSGSTGVSLLVVDAKGVQNGPNDGIALVNNVQAVQQFISYQGILTASNGPASGMTSIDIGVKESFFTLPGRSLQLVGTGCKSSRFVWLSPTSATRGKVNKGQTLSGCPVTSPPSAPVPIPTGPIAPPTTPILPPTAPVSLPTTPVSPVSPPTSPVSETTSAWINELHYDNSGTDSGEFIEIASATGFDLTGYTLVLYNGGGGASYNTQSIPVGNPSGMGVSLSVIDYAVNGIQNGNPDGVALVDKSNRVIEFISYGGTFTATGGPANGMLSVDIGVTEGPTTPVGASLQRSGTGCQGGDFTWQGPQQNSRGSINTGQTFNCSPLPPNPVQAPVPVVVPTPVKTPVVAPTVPIGQTPGPVPSTGSPLDSNMLTSATGSGTKSFSVPFNGMIDIGYIPAGIADIYIRVDSSSDIDVQLFDDQTKLISREGGYLSDRQPGIIKYGAVRLQYSGYNGEHRSGTFGQEFIFIAGIVPRDFRVKLFGYQSSGSATVKYRWGYYNSAYGMTGATLKNALHSIISGHTKISYSACWAALARSDQDNLNTSNIITHYSGLSKPKTAQNDGCSCPDSFDREHTWPQSHGNFGTSQGPGTDIHSLRLEDKEINNDRSDKDFDAGGSPLSTPSLQQKCPTCRETSSTWEPSDLSKGSVARIIFYMTTRYNGDSGSNGYTLTVVQGTTSTSTGNGQLGSLSTLKAWNDQFDVTDFEIYRNNIVYEIQGNRNPFIDHPEWVDLIF